MNKVIKSEDELKEDFKLQLELLKVLADQYDKGDTIVGKSIATSIRVLVYDTDNSHSLLSQLCLKNRKFFDTASPVVEGVSGETQRIGSFCGLVGIGVGIKNKQSYIPYLDETPGDKFGFVDFNEYWNRNIFIDNNKNKFTRKDIVLAITNQDGGAHVDPKIDEKYKQLSRQNSLGWKTSVDGKIWDNSQGSELATVRQIAHELLHTFEPDYPYKKMVTGNTGMVIGGMSFLISKTTSHIPKLLIKNRKIGVNEKCPCNSGLKYKKCHGK
jgi:hypothetical protein